jgi:hypothetical protein
MANKGRNRWTIRLWAVIVFPNLRIDRVTQMSIKKRPQSKADIKKTLTTVGNTWTVAHTENIQISRNTGSLPRRFWVLKLWKRGLQCALYSTVHNICKLTVVLNTIVCTVQLLYFQLILRHILRQILRQILRHNLRHILRHNLRHILRQILRHILRHNLRHICKGDEISIRRKHVRFCKVVYYTVLYIIYIYIRTYIYLDLWRRSG